MKKALIPIAIVGAICMAGMKESSTSGRNAEQTAAIQKAVLKSHQEMIEAMAKLDVDKFFESIIDSGQGTIIQDGRIMTGKESLERSRRGLGGVSQLKYEFSRKIVKVLSPQTAVFIGQGKSTVTRGTGEVFDNDFVVTSVFVLADGQWKIVHGHHSTINPQ